MLEKKVSCDFKTLLTALLSRERSSQISFHFSSLALYFQSGNAVKATAFPENGHWLNLFLTSSYFLCHLLRSWATHCKTFNRMLIACLCRSQIAASRVCDRVCADTSLAAACHFDFLQCNECSWKNNIFSPLSSNPWVISWPITIPIPPKFRACGWCLLKKGGCRIPAGKTAKRGRERAML